MNAINASEGVCIRVGIGEILGAGLPMAIIGS